MDEKIDKNTFAENVAIVVLIEALVKALKEFNTMISNKSQVNQIMEDCICAMCDQIKNNIKTNI